MREILFRGKDQYNDWIYGYLCQYRGDSIADNGGDLLDDSDYYIRDWTEKIDTGFYGCNYKVRPSTVSQYTGLTDKDGRKIFEGDILSIAQKGNGIGDYFYPPLKYPSNAIVKWDKCSWMWEIIAEQRYYLTFPDAWCHFESKIIGNIHDNPELLEVDK